MKKADYLWTVIAAALLGVAAAVSGCAHESAYRRADCERFRMKGYVVLACDDDAVGQHCAKGARVVGSPHKRLTPRADNGKILDYLPRACTHHRFAAFGRKKVINIGKSYMGCLSHEIAHLEYPDRPAYVESNFPCVGDRGR